ncbi:hypothetical protein OnM2_057053 [Erysiphe neolycopersici]|uniref:Wax synthase domain-containing protein n=1 Tax=Erysiphe neolycopersici TaxID=212602 RepID=A0A420HQS3_9PEZI|nr:hypothetical protein OnM2_057053 [Erysiphe neolycopersici]
MASHFPHLTSTGPAPSASEIYLTYHQTFVDQVIDGQRRPLVFPYDFLGFFSLLVYLCIPHKQNPIIYAARWPLIVLVTWIELRKIHESLGTGPDLVALTGMISAYIVISSWTWLIFKRPQWDAARVEKRRIRVAKNVQLSEKIPALKEELCLKKQAIDNVSINTDGCYEEIDEYFWQSYPENIKERIYWVFDLILNYRGPGWNWAIPNIPSLTPETLSKLESSVLDESDQIIASAIKKCLKTRHAHLLNELCVFVLSYLTIDILATLMIYDPYFKFGPTTYDLPPYLQHLHPSMLQFYRLLVTSVTIGIGINYSFAQAHITLAHFLGPRVLGLRGTHWYYPRIWGEFSDILQKGLGGLWGSYWHQSFRNLFTAPTKYLIREGYIKTGSFAAKIIGLIFAFGLSGFLHWAPSMTSIRSTYPFGQALFFLLQGVGVALQDVLSKMFSPLITKLPPSVRQTTNMVYTLSWLYITGSYAADDFARSGVWLIKILPFSPMEALGFGEHNSYRNFMKHFSFMWHTGNHWWESGITLI